MGDLYKSPKSPIFFYWRCIDWVIAKKWLYIKQEACTTFISCSKRNFNFYAC